MSDSTVTEGGVMAAIEQAIGAMVNARLDRELAIGGRVKTHLDNMQLAIMARHDNSEDLLDRVIGHIEGGDLDAHLEGKIEGAIETVMEERFEKLLDDYIEEKVRDLLESATFSVEVSL